MFPRGCFVLAPRLEVWGYLIAYPQAVGVIPPLNSLVGELPTSPEAIYLHDLALHPNVRGQGYAKLGFDQLLAALTRLQTTIIHLVAVNGSSRFWKGLGFEAAATGQMQSYGDDATYMVRQ